MNDALFYGFLALATFVAMVCAERILDRMQHRAREDFDGGFSHDNDIRVTRIQSPHIVSTKGEHHE